jgi:putative thiamine transport system permease protein
MPTRLGPLAAALLLAGPVLAGLAGTLLPAFGYLPALGGTRFSLEPFARLLAEPGLWRSAAVSLAAGPATAAASLLVVMLFVAGFAGTRIFARLLHLVSPLLSVPHAAAAFGLAFLVVPSGMLARLVSPWLTGWQRPPDLLILNDPCGLAMTAGLVVKEIPFLLLMTMAALPQVKPARTRAIAASLGYGRIAGFVFCLWPPLYRQIRLPVFAVIAFSGAVVDVAQILGPTVPATLSVRLVEWMGDPDLSMRYQAAAGALLQLGVTALSLALWIGLEWLCGSAARAARERGFRFRRDRALRAAALAAMALAAATVLAGLATLSLWSVAGLWPFPDALPARLGLDTWAATLPRVGRPLATTLAAGLAATLIAVAVVILCLMHEEESGRRAGRFMLALVYLPLIVPQAAFLFGLQLLFLAAGAGTGLAALVAVHLVFVLPYVYLSLADPWRAFDRRYENVARGLGRSRRAAMLSVRLPMLLRAILTAAALGFAVSIGQYLPTLLIGAGRLTTITTEAVALAAGGDRRVIGVYAFLQMLLPAAGFAVATLVPALLFRRRRALRI